MQITQTLQRALQINKDGIATIFDDRQLTYENLYHRVAKLGGALHNLGLADNDRVAVLALNSDKYVELLFGIPWAGGIIVPLNFRLSPTELIYMLNDSESRMLIVDDTTATMLPEFEGMLDSVEHIIFMGNGDTPIDVLNFDTLVDDAEPIADMGRNGDDILAIFYTGGTTGLPKGVMTTHTNMMSDIPMQTPYKELGDRAMRWLIVTPIFHVSGSVPIFTTIGHGGTCILRPKFEPDDALKMIEQHSATVSFWAPTMVNMMLEHPNFDNYDLTSLTVVLYASSPMPLAVATKAMQQFPHVFFVHVYGMTETSGGVTWLDPRYHVTDGAMSRIKSGGQPVFNSEIKIVDANDNEVPRGELGELIVRSPVVMKGYWKKPEDTAIALRNGWMHSGDVGYMDNEGFIYIVDRLKDMIITGGENVYSVEVEHVIHQHPAVAMCAVIGIPDDKWGESIHAIITLRDGTTITSEDIISHCREHIAHYKCPRSVTIRDEALPLSSAGKILKRDLRAPFWEGYRD